MNKVFFSFVQEYPKNVVISQVVEYLEMLEEFDLNFNLVFLIRLGAYVSGFKDLPKYRTQINNRISGDVSFYPISRKTNRMGVWVSVFHLIFKFFKYRNFDKIVIHSRGAMSADVARTLKRFYKNIEYVYDIRGDVAAEYNYHAKKNNVPKPERERMIEKDRRKQEKLTSEASGIFCVSNVLKSRVIDNYKADTSKINVIPCLADHHKFFFDSKIREEKRKEFGFENKLVIVYPGGIGYWHYSDKVFEVIRDLTKINNNVYFVILTPSVREAEEYANKYLEKDTYFIKKAARDEVPAFLMAADLGILLREHHPLNEVAAPTKFAEYLMTGLPVMISEDIGDYSNFIKESNFGFVLSHNCQKEEYVEKFKEFAETSFDRVKISEVAKENFAKIKYAKIMKDVYTTI